MIRTKDVVYNTPTQLKQHKRPSGKHHMAEPALALAPLCMLGLRARERFIRLIADFADSSCCILGVCHAAEVMAAITHESIIVPGYAFPARSCKKDSPNCASTLALTFLYGKP